MMKCLLVVAVFLTAVPAYAITRYNSTSMSCDAVRGTIRQEDAVIMRYRSTRNPSLQLFGRYVNDDRFCRQSERAETVFIPRPIESHASFMSANPSTSTTITQF